MIMPLGLGLTPTRLKRSSLIHRRERAETVGESLRRTESPERKQSTQQAEDLQLLQQHEPGRYHYNVELENSIGPMSSHQQQQLVPEPLNVRGSKALVGPRARSVTEPLVMPQQEEVIPPVPRVPQRYMPAVPAPLSLVPVAHKRAENEHPSAQGLQIEESNKEHVQEEQQQSEKARLKQVQVNRPHIERPNFGRPQTCQPKFDETKPDQPKHDQPELDHQQFEPKRERFHRDLSAPVNVKAKTAGKSILRYGGGKGYHELMKEIMPPAAAPPKVTKPPLPSPLPDFLLNPPEFLKHPPELSKQMPHTSYLDDEPDLDERGSSKLIKSETSSKLTNKPSSAVKTLFKARSFQRLRRRSNSQSKDQQAPLRGSPSCQPLATQTAKADHGDDNDNKDDDEIALTSRWSSDSSDERPPPTESRLKKLKRVFSIPALRQRKSSFFSREKPDLEARGSVGSGGSGKDSSEGKRSSASGSSGSKKSGG